MSTEVPKAQEEREWEIKTGAMISRVRATHAVLASDGRTLLYLHDALIAIAPKRAIVARGKV